MASTLITAYLGKGTAAARPATPLITTGSLGIYYATDTDVMSFYLNGAWRNAPLYDPGTVPTVVQVAFTPNHATGVTFGVAPTNGNLLIAMNFNTTAHTAAAGWTLQFENTSGTDFGSVFSKVAGAGESTSQTPITAAGTAGGMVVWEIAGANATFLAAGASQAEQSGTASLPVSFPCVKNCLALSAVGVVTGVTISKQFNAGVQDVLDNTGERKLYAGHTDITKTPLAGVFVGLSGTGSSKSITVLITS